MQTNTEITQTNEAATHAPSAPAGFVNSLFSFNALTGLLRILGATVLIASVSIFLLQGWESGNDVQRYLLLLAHTVLLAGTGFASGHWIKESKGARLFLALALISVSVNFAILGGLLYSQLQWDSALVAYPDFATWRAEDLSLALITTGGALLLLGPVAWLGFMALARRSAAQLTVLYLLGNAVLLVPVRGSAVIGILIVVATLGILAQVSRASRHDATLRTNEGLFARAVQFLPVGIILSRSLYLYATDAFLTTVAALVVFIVLRQISRQMDGTSAIRTTLEFFSVIPAGFAAAGLAAVVDDVWTRADSFELPVFTLSLAALIVEISLRCSGRGAGYRRIASVIVAAGMLANLFMFGNVATAAMCLVAGIAVTVYGYSVQQRLIFGLGLLTLLLGLGHQVGYAVEMFDLGSWGSLALLGIIAIVSGSMLERHGADIKLRFKNWRQRFQSWDY